MSLNSKVVLNFLAGLFAGMIAWVVIDFNPWYHLPPSGALPFIQQLYQSWPLFALFGVAVGTALGLVGGLSTDSSAVTRRSVGWGAGIGLFGGLAGLFFGQLFFGELYDLLNGLERVIPPIVFLWKVLARAIGWGLIGFFVGLAQGIAARSTTTARHGAIGGLLGGLLGGSLFETVPHILMPPGANPDASSIVARGISMTTTGAAIGFFVGLVEVLLKQAWVRVIQGRNEGREYIISKQRTTIGRNELSDIGLFGDRNISPLHAVIEIRNGRHVLLDAGSSIGTFVGGQQVREHLLRDGDVIRIGSMELQFHEKATASRVQRPVDTEAKPGPSIPTVAGICPFCGGRKDPTTGACDCTVSPAPAGVPTAMPQIGAPPPTPIPPQAGIGPRLIGITGPYAGQTLSLPSAGASIGREQGRDLVLGADISVSRRHGRIANEGGVYVVYDEGSSNGTFVNGSRVTRQELSPGDVIAFGGSSFRFET